MSLERDGLKPPGAPDAASMQLVYQTWRRHLSDVTCHKREIVNKITDLECLEQMKQLSSCPQDETRVAGVAEERNSGSLQKGKHKAVLMCELRGVQGSF